MARKKTRGAVIQPSGRVQPGYDSFPLKRRASNIIPLPTKQSPLTSYTKDQARLAEGRPRTHVTSYSKRSRRKLSSKNQPTKSAPSPTCSKLEFQPAATLATTLAYVPVVIDFEADNAGELVKHLESTAGMPISTLGLGPEHDTTLINNTPGPSSVAKMIELAFALSGAPYIAVMRQAPTEEDWLINAVQVSMDNRSPLVLVGIGRSGTFEDCSLVLERNSFFKTNNVLNSSLWRLVQRIILI